MDPQPLAGRSGILPKSSFSNNNKNIPKNLLLFGDASFDYKDINSTNTNFVPTFQSYRSDNIKLSY